jgi:hypothetical protein
LFQVRNMFFSSANSIRIPPCTPLNSTTDCPFGFRAVVGGG